MFRPLIVLAALSLPAAAQDVDCADAVAQADLNACAYQDWQAADAELNAAYAQAMSLAKSWDADLPQDEQGAALALKEGQRAWITFRDKTCEAEGYAMKGGSAEPLVVYGCLHELTTERTGHLEAMTQDYGG